MLHLGVDHFSAFAVQVSQTAPAPPHLTDLFCHAPSHPIKKNPRNAPASNRLSQVKEFKDGCSSGFHSFLQLS